MKYSKIALFHSDGCIHCTNFLPAWKEISQRVDAEECPGVTCASFKGDDIPEKENIMGYPTIRLYGGNGQKYDWYGPREPSVILSLLKGKLSPKSEAKWIREVEEEKPAQSGGKRKRKVIPKYQDSDEDAGAASDDDLKYKIKYMKYKAKYFHLRDKLAQEGG